MRIVSSLSIKWGTRGVLSLLLVAVSFVGCAESDKATGEVWERFHVLDFGQRPIPSPDGQLLAFASEETADHTAGIYLLKQDSIVPLTTGLPPHSWDYVWSPDNQYLAFSTPGQPGTETAGIWIMNVLSRNLQQLWDRGSAPSWDPEDANVLYCAGPEDGTENEGIFRISLNPPTRIRLYEWGRSPKMSPDGRWLAFQVAEIEHHRAALWILSMDNLDAEPLAQSVGDFCWVFDSRRIIYESLEGGGMDLFEVSITVPHQPTEFVSQASMPAAFLLEGRVAFVKLSGDVSLGIWIAEIAGSSRSLTATGVRPQPAEDGNAVYFEDSDGIHVLRRFL